MVNAGILLTKSPPEIRDIIKLMISRHAYSIDKQIKQSDQIGCVRSCIYLSISNKNYIISTGTLVKNAMDSMAFLETIDGYENYECQQLRVIDEFDLSISYINDTVEAKGINIDDMSSVCYLIPEIGSHCTIVNNTLFMDGECEDVDIAQNNFDCVIKNITCTKLVSNICPLIPIMELEMKYLDESINIDSIAGSPVINNNMLIGMVHSYNRTKETFYAIPIYCIIKILKAYIKDNNYKPASIFINSSFGSNNGDFISEYLDTAVSCTSQIKRNVSIMRINQIQVNDSGLIYCKEMNMLLPYDTYCMFYEENNKINITQKENKMQHNKIKNIDMATIPIEIISALSLASSNIIVWGGVIFTELSEDIIHLHIACGNKIGGYSKNLYNKRCSYRSIVNSVKKITYYALININWNDISSDESCQYIKHGFPLILENNEHIIPLLYKINGKRIKCLDDLIETIKQPLNQFECTYNTKDSTKVIIMKNKGTFFIRQ